MIQYNVNGNFHPTLKFIRDSVNYFTKLGFEIAIGPEIESEYYNFDFLRIPSNHPSRDVQDTFWIDDKKLLRTQTSTMQGRVTRDWKVKPPLRVIAPGKVFRNESTDPSHEAVFHQLEGFVIDRGINMANLIATINNYLKYMFEDIEIRVYPHHYPFVEPGMDVAIKWNGRWLEVLGCGLIHPEVIENMNIDSNKWRGLAFGMGVDRLAMLKYKINDIRSLYHPDLRLNYQFY